MGTAPVTVTPTARIRLLQSHRGPCSITNLGPNTAYLDDDASVSALAFDKALAPGESVDWADSTDCWVISDPLGSTQVNLAFRASGSSSAALGGSGSQATTVIYDGPMSTLNNIFAALDVRRFQSIRIICTSTITTDAFPVAPQVRWHTEKTAANFQTGFDAWTLNNDSATDYGYEVALDVRAPFFYLFPSGIGTLAADPSIIVLGYATRQPTITRESGHGGIFTGESPSWITGGAIAVGADGPAIALPLWSGTMQIELTFVYTGAVGTPAYALLYDTWNGSLYGGLVLTPLIQAPTLLVYRGLWTLKGSRRPRTLQLFRGAGYATVTPRYGISFYGSEDA